ncbi:hypothetical protein OH492_09270 [Vibrio chagasii]|nr:hypothetical protein [Vibrio chagasii]
MVINNISEHSYIDHFAVTCVVTFDDLILELAFRNAFTTVLIVTGVNGDNSGSVNNGNAGTPERSECTCD